MRTTLARALAWRLGRQFLLDGARAAEQVVGRLGAVPAWSGNPDLAIRRRLVTSTPREVDRALETTTVATRSSSRSPGRATCASDPR